MTQNEILKNVDYTLLKQTATCGDIQRILDFAIKNDCASACIPPCFVPMANYYVNGNISICTVIGFPNGYMAKEVKEFEAKQAIEDGASEIDMVVNINHIKEGHYDIVLEEIKAIEKICQSHIVKVPLKVIIETCLLTKEEIKKMCEIVAFSGADYIKTSTGFSTGGANFEDIQIIKNEMDKWNNNDYLKRMFPERDKIRIKASGGIKTFKDAEKYLMLGVDRIGTSGLS